jgi:hypothetical protein
VSKFKVYSATIDVVADNFIDACTQVRTLLRPGVGFTVRERVGEAPSARAVLGSGAMRWAVTVPGQLGGEPCELMVAFDPGRRRGVVVVMTADQADKISVGTPVHLGPKALADMLSAIRIWPEEVIARMVTEDALCENPAPAPAPGAK